MSREQFALRGYCTCGKWLPALAAGVVCLYAICPDCGVPTDQWEVKTTRWVSTATFWPWTWGRGYWETTNGERYTTPTTTNEETEA